MQTRRKRGGGDSVGILHTGQLEAPGRVQGAHHRAGVGPFETGLTSLYLSGLSPKLASSSSSLLMSPSSSMSPCLLLPFTHAISADCLHDAPHNISDISASQYTAIRIRDAPTFLPVERSRRTGLAYTATSLGRGNMQEDFGTSCRLHVPVTPTHSMSTSYHTPYLMRSGSPHPSAGLSLFSTSRILFASIPLRPSDPRVPPLLVGLRI